MSVALQKCFAQTRNRGFSATVAKIVAEASTCATTRHPELQMIPTTERKYIITRKVIVRAREIDSQTPEYKINSSFSLHAPPNRAPEKP